MTVEILDEIEHLVLDVLLHPGPMILRDAHVFQHFQVAEQRVRQRPGKRQPVSASM